MDEDESRRVQHSTLPAAFWTDPQTLRDLVEKLRPVVRARVLRALHKHAANRRRGYDSEELTQEVFLVLFARDARVLRTWDAQRGLSLANFAGLVAERVVSNIVRSERGQPRVHATDASSPSQVDHTADPEAMLTARQLASNLGSRVATWSPMAENLFVLLFVEELHVSEVSSATGLSRDAVYAWRSRLTRALQALVLELNR